MPNGCGDLRTLRNGEDFVERGENLIALGTLVSEINAVVLASDLGEFNDFVGRGKDARNIRGRC